ncbi:hypothetical protein TRV_05117 [Trichophyton verrucosum HKI 0517]|uniref:Aminoglycoside phosphotransferase domain-containing protein n=1 Tax=Trichophyton verrucosum (strain HKI 0517) TaxID=663202 RepID=D4DDA9_TRIVH|nr:uncharacterized protein TRV_05117 [Trichophyton verrucosum HKI 0517]EFE40165.1 hypothetical protein TRV_05117 [Trichophyton verrucosum HKI 0517]
MWEPVSIPFQSDALSLPLPLPTADEIRTCPNILWECYSSKVVAVNDAVVVKFGRMVDASEGQALIYLERYAPEIPAPRLYAMFKESNELSLIMQRVPGIPLDKIWPSLTESEKNDISTKLRQIFDNTANRYLGPFYSEAAFIAGFIGNHRAVVRCSDRPDFKVRFYETYLPRVLQGHRPTLTHGDVQRKNILVAENPNHIDDQSGRSFDIVLVDWANAGWYPGYWEFFRAASPMGFEYGEDDWFWRAQEFLQVWPAELALMRMIDKDNRGY